MGRILLNISKLSFILMITYIATQQNIYWQQADGKIFKI